MKRVVFILTFLLILIFRQTSPELFVRDRLGDCVVIQETNIINDTPGLGWIEDKDNCNQKEMALRIETFRMEEGSLADVKSKKSFKFSIISRFNPFLIDLPPPACDA